MLIVIRRAQRAAPQTRRAVEAAQARQSVAAVSNNRDGCPRCEGSGVLPNGDKCPRCDGIGHGIPFPDFFFAFLATQDQADWAKTLGEIAATSARLADDVASDPSVARLVTPERLADLMKLMATLATGWQETMRKEGMTRVASLLQPPKRGRGRPSTHAKARGMFGNLPGVAPADAPVKAKRGQPARYTATQRRGMLMDYLAKKEACQKSSGGTTISDAVFVRRVLCKVVPGLKSSDAPRLIKDISLWRNEFGFPVRKKATRASRNPGKKR